MKKSIVFIALSIMLSGMSFSQENPFSRLEFIIGDWFGTGNRFRK